MSRTRNKSQRKSSPVKKQQSTTTRRQNSQQVLQVTKQFSGPVPPPSILEQYDQVVPGSAERIIAMAEREMDHRRDVELKIISKEYTEAGRGQIFALTIGTIAIIAAGFISVTGAQWTASVIGGGGVIGLVSVFILGRRDSWRRQHDGDSPE